MACQLLESVDVWNDNHMEEVIPLSQHWQSLRKLEVRLMEQCLHYMYYGVLHTTFVIDVSKL